MDEYEIKEMLQALLLIVILIAVGVGVKGFMAEEAMGKAESYNKLYGTSYTQREMFWNYDDIKKFHAKQNPKRPQENQINATLKLS